MIEIIAFCVGTARLKKLGIHHGMLRPLRPFRFNPPPTTASICTSHTLPPRLGIDPYGHHVGSYAAHGPEADPEQDPISGSDSDLEKVAKISNVRHAHHHMGRGRKNRFRTT